MNKHKIAAVIPASGIGSRMGSAKPKQYIKIAGQSILQHTLAKFERLTICQKIVLVANPNDEDLAEIIAQCSDKVVVVPGGETRAASVLSGLSYLSRDGFDWVMVHDAARPCVGQADIERLVRHCLALGHGGILATQVKDTIKQANNEGQVLTTHDRSHLWHAQTPQFFPHKQLLSALTSALKDPNVIVTDEAAAMELARYPVELVVGTASNIKITTPDDLQLAEFYLNKEREKCV
ncbi:2-C-methyl-D-erythritol 4-phosphate cytidylyltransferase [Gayadomonas joobiniege]|uniref:2-C-methyl-D-erythritol 4-phosphate cytidylyltransferase n=1 Tax=Gayadomonas joobiniege TaxID=1234606 RepID=UPI00035DBBFB|nr:2-C-methyl-D-erythritol 4-phosphate cytidylyltransferase [Gayadomonas joobiniege]